MGLSITFFIVTVAYLWGFGVGDDHIATIVDYQGFDAKADAQVLRKAMKGWGSNKERISSVVTMRSYNQRLQISKEYHQLFKRDLIADLKSESSGDIKVLFVSLFYEPDEFYAHEVLDAVAGLGTNEAALNDVFCCLTDVSMESIRVRFKSLFKKDIKKEVDDDVSGDYKRLLSALMTEKRRTGVDHDYVNRSVARLQKAGVKKWFGTDETQFISIFAESSFDELKLIAEQYESATKKLLSDSVRSETSGDFMDLLIQILNFAEDPVKYYARRAKVALHGTSRLHGKDIRILTRILVRRAEIDMGNIRAMYSVLFDRGLDNDVKASTSQPYTTAALNLINGNKR